MRTSMHHNNLFDNDQQDDNDANDDDNDNDEENDDTWVGPGPPPLQWFALFHMK